MKARDLGAASVTYEKLAAPVFGRHKLVDVHQASGVIAGVTCVTVIVIVIRDGFAQRLDGKIPDRVGFHEPPDLLD